MLARLSSLPWRRVDVSFTGCRMPYTAHNLIQVCHTSPPADPERPPKRPTDPISDDTGVQHVAHRPARPHFPGSPALQQLSSCCRQVTRRWVNFEGVGVPRHLARQLAALDALDRASGSQRDSAAAQRENALQTA